MIGTALLFDVMQFIIELIPVVGQIISILITGIAWATFLLWFKIKGVKFTKARKFAFAAGGILEFLPVGNMLPLWTVSVAITIGKKQLEKAAGVVPGGKQAVDKALS